MKKLLCALMLCGSAVGQNRIYVVPPTPKAITGGVQSVTAIVTGNADKTVNWTKTGAACGAFVGSGNTIGVHTTGTGTCTVTGTMDADGTTTASSVITVEAVRTDLQATNVHPRIGLTPADVTDLQTKTGAGNAAWVNLQGQLTYAESYYTANFNWSGGSATVGPKTPTALNSTAYSLSGCPSACAITITVPNSLTGTEIVTLNNYATATWLNNQPITLNAATGTTISGTFNNPSFTHANGSASESGKVDQILNSCGWIGSGCAPSAIENDALLYALAALIDPTTGNRATWAAHAHDLAMWEIYENAYGTFTGSGPAIPRNYANKFMPYLGAFFIVANRPQTLALPQFQSIDWNYASFTSPEKAVMASLFHIWGAQLTGANSADQVDGPGESPMPVGTYSDPVLFNTNVSTEVGGTNNYGMGQGATAAYLGLLLDPADDPTVSSCAPTTTTICATDGSAKTVGAYAVAALKAWGYRNYAALEDQHIVNAAYGLSDPDMCPDLANPALNTKTINCTGTQSGGFSEVTTEYSPLSNYDNFNGWYALYTAGKLNPATDPQAAFISSAYWDKLALNMVHQLYPSIPAGGTANYTAFGDDQSYGNHLLDMGQLFNSMEVYDAKYGSTWRKDLDKWYQYNALLDGQASYAFRWMGSGGGGYGIYGGWAYNMNIMQATDATNDGDFTGAGAPNPTINQYDPRNTSTLPLDFEAASSPGGFYRYYGRDSWATNGTEFQFGSNTAVQSHAPAWAGRFDYLPKGEPAITAMNGYIFTQNRADYANIAGYQWNPSYPCSSDSVWPDTCNAGGEQPFAGKFSNLVLGSSSNGNYYYGATDGSGTYFSSFGTGDASNVNLAQREVLWLKPDLIWVYDRAETVSDASFKKWNVNTQTLPAISGNLATETTDGGQKVFISSLQPGTSSWTATSVTPPGGAPVNALLTDTASSGTPVRMLHTIERKDSGSPSFTVSVFSASGDSFEGGVVGTTIVMFKHTRGTFTGVTYPASSATTHYVTDLAPNTAYVITGPGTPGGATSDSAGVLTFAASGTGNITIGAGTPTTATPSCTPSGGTFSSPQSVTCSSTTPASTTYCTIDGSTPTSGSPVCTGISVASTLTLKAISAASGFMDSAILPQVYTIVPPTVQKMVISWGTTSGTAVIQ